MNYLTPDQIRKKLEELEKIIKCLGCDISVIRDTLYEYTTTTTSTTTTTTIP